jgi:hypothetical protein
MVGSNENRYIHTYVTTLSTIFASSSSPFSDYSFWSTTLLTGMSWSFCWGIQGFGVHCAPYIRHMVVSHPGFKARSSGFAQAFRHSSSSLCRCCGLLQLKGLAASSSDLFAHNTLDFFVHVDCFSHTVLYPYGGNSFCAVDVVFVSRTEDPSLNLD